MGANFRYMQMDPTQTEMRAQSGGQDGESGTALTPTLSHRMGEGERFDALRSDPGPGFIPCGHWSPLSPRTGEGQGEGAVGCGAFPPVASGHFDGFHPEPSGRKAIQ